MEWLSNFIIYAKIKLSVIAFLKTLIRLLRFYYCNDKLHLHTTTLCSEKSSTSYGRHTYIYLHLIKYYVRHLCVKILQKHE